MLTPFDPPDTDQLSISDAYANYLLTINWISGASSSSLFAYSGIAEPEQSTLFHQTDSQHLPEMETTEKAIEFLESRLEAPAWVDSHTRNRIHVENSQFEQGLLIYFGHFGHVNTIEPPNQNERRTSVQLPLQDIDTVTLIGLRFDSKPPDMLRDLVSRQTDMHSTAPSDQTDWFGRHPEIGR